MRSTLPATAFAVSLGIGLSVVAGTFLIATPAVATRVQDSTATATIATCNSLTILENMYGADPYVSARDQLANTLRTEIEGMQAQMSRLEAEIGLMTGQDPNRPLKINQYNALREQLQIRTSEATSQLQTFNAEQLIEIYGIIAAKSEEIATANGYTHLFMTRTGDQDFDPRVGVAGVIQDILARPLTMAPSTTDITELVREALNVPVPVANDAVEDSTVAPAPGGG